MICSRCHENKAESNFYKRSANRQNSLHTHCKKCHAKFKHEQWKDRKRKAVKLMGGKCSACGYKRCLAALEFHHLDPDQKNREWSGIVRMKWERAIIELKKCILLCSNCHRERHADASMFEFDVIDGSSDILLNASPLAPSGLCPSCDGEVFETRYCSQLCAKVARRKVPRPTKQQLAKDIDAMTMVDIGKKYGVSDNAVRKWARWYGI